MDREKVINDLQDAVNDDWMWQHADYYAKTMENAIAMLKEQENDIHHMGLIIEEYEKELKEQEAVKPTWSRGKPHCGACGLRIRGGKFCSECGKPIAWEGR